MAELDSLQRDFATLAHRLRACGELDEPPHFHGEITLDEESGKTRIALTLIFQSREARQAAVDFGAVEGGQQTLEKLARFVAGLAARA